MANSVKYKIYSEIRTSSLGVRRNCGTDILTFWSHTFHAKIGAFIPSYICFSPHLKAATVSYYAVHLVDASDILGIITAVECDLESYYYAVECDLESYCLSFCPFNFIASFTFHPSENEIKIDRSYQTGA